MVQYQPQKEERLPISCLISLPSSTEGSIIICLALQVSAELHWISRQPRSLCTVTLRKNNTFQSYQSFSGNLPVPITPFLWGLQQISFVYCAKGYLVSFGTGRYGKEKAMQSSSSFLGGGVERSLLVFVFSNPKEQFQNLGNQNYCNCGLCSPFCSGQSLSDLEISSISNISKGWWWGKKGREEVLVFGSFACSWILQAGFFEEITVLSCPVQSLQACYL